MALLPDITDPQATLSSIVSLGYDTDTVGAIGTFLCIYPFPNDLIFSAGTVLGARFGTSWIPKERFLDLERLNQYADALVTRNKSQVEDLQSYLKAEASWTTQYVAVFFERIAVTIPVDQREGVSKSLQTNGSGQKK
jgi:hypothetical protein